MDGEIHPEEGVIYSCTPEQRQARTRSQVARLSGWCPFQPVLLHPSKRGIAPGDPEFCWPQEPLSQMQPIPMISLNSGLFLFVLHSWPCTRVHVRKYFLLQGTAAHLNWKPVPLRHIKYVHQFLTACVQTSLGHFVGDERGKAWTSPHGDGLRR